MATFLYDLVTLPNAPKFGIRFILVIIYSKFDQNQFIEIEDRRYGMETMFGWEAV